MKSFQVVMNENAHKAIKTVAQYEGKTIGEVIGEMTKEYLPGKLLKMKKDFDRKMSFVDDLLKKK